LVLRLPQRKRRISIDMLMMAFVVWQFLKRLVLERIGRMMNIQAWKIKIYPSDVRKSHAPIKREW
jgi:hypothetical protein